VSPLPTLHYDSSDGLAVLRLDAPSLNAISLAVLDDLRAAVDRARRDDQIQAIVIIGTATHFSAGADLGIFHAIRTAEDAIRTCRTFQDAFQAIEDSAKPVVAALAGQVMGGALELALACHARVATRATRFSMPEVTLGLNPGAGGTQRLPRVVGPAAALRLLLTGEPIAARQALSLTLIDAVCEEEELLACARRAALETALQEPRRPRRAFPPDEAAFAEAEKLIARHRPEFVAPRKILEAVRIGLQESFEAGLQYEREAFAACMATPAARNKLYLFFAQRATGRIDELAGVEPRRIEKVAVVGMGTMGSGIAQALVQANLPTVVLDENPDAAARGVAKIRGSLTRRVEEGKLAPEQCQAMLARLTTTSNWDDLAEADLVVEAVFEDLGIKQSVFGRLEEVCRKEAILASNTSTISLDALASSLQAPERLVGLHFFNPAYRMPLLEIIRTPETSPATIATALQLARLFKKTPVLVRNREGFLVSRLFVPYLKEAFWLWQEGAEPAEIDRAMVEFGFPMGPLALIDMSGLDILELTDRVLRRAFPHHGEMPPIVSRLYEAGHLGQKTGAGVYRYEAGGYTPHSSEAAEALLAEIRLQQGLEEMGTGSGFDHNEITRRLVLRMVCEAFRIVEEGIAREAADLDVAVVLGIGFPDFRGGVLRYAEDLGYRNVLTELEKLSARWGERFAPCELLRRKGAEDGQCR